MNDILFGFFIGIPFGVLYVYMIEKIKDYNVN